MKTDCKHCIPVRNSTHRLTYYCKLRLSGGITEKHWKCVGIKSDLCPLNGEIESNETTVQMGTARKEV
jgi:hypothetical protein